MAADAVSEPHFACFWLRGIIPMPWLEVTKPPAERSVHTVCGPAVAWLGPGLYTTDGSVGKHSQDP
eukprot:97006-Heterocapsa_arctica.AAC.1